MGLFDTLVKVATSAMSGGNQAGEQNQALDMVMDLINQNGGNVGGLLQQLQQGGLGDALQSWISTDENAEVSAGDIENALGGGLDQVAAKFGLDNQQAGGLLAQYLPKVIDMITPNGSAADADGFGMDDIARIAMEKFMK